MSEQYLTLRRLLSSPAKSSGDREQTGEVTSQSPNDSNHGPRKLIANFAIQSFPDPTEFLPPTLTQHLSTKSGQGQFATGARNCLHATALMQAVSGSMRRLARRQALTAFEVRSSKLSSSHYAGRGWAWPGRARVCGGGLSRERGRRHTIVTCTFDLVPASRGA